MIDDQNNSRSKDAIASTPNVVSRQDQFLCIALGRFASFIFSGKVIRSINLQPNGIYRSVDVGSLPFVECKCALGFFDVSPHAAAKLLRAMRDFSAMSEGT
jgi:hypothetical protein